MNECEAFMAALDFDAPDERARYLDKVCGTDTPLRQRVDKLLDSHSKSDSLFEHPAIDPAATQWLEETEKYVQAQANGNSLEDVSLDFLEPSDEPRVLGRLAQYHVCAVIGHGGMGIVLRAVDTKLNRVVAIKVLAPELAANAAARKRFLREAQAAAAVSHDHVVTIYAVEENQRSKDSSRAGRGSLPYLVMEFIDGPTLQQKIDKDGSLGLKEILRIGRQVAAGLAAAHEQGLIHRDVKPGNILLQNGVERVQITDFGLARAADDVGITQTGEVAGTPQYMSPEQAQGKPIDVRSDLFSLGSVMYAMCTGRSPFRAETTIGSLRRVCDDTPRPIREVNPDIPEWLVTIVDRLLEKDPDDRFQTADEVADLLSRHLAHLQNPQLASLPDPVTPAKSKSPRCAFRRRRWVAAAAILVVVCGLTTISEATGVTNLAATVIRIATGEGTLVIEVDDPTVQVSLDGEELSITGTGIQELKLRPGQYEFRAAKGGQPVKQLLVNITRGGRQVVRVTREPVLSSADARDSATDYRSVPEGSITRVRRLAGHTDGITCIRALGDGRRCLTAGHDGTVRLWDTHTSGLLKTFAFGACWREPLAVAPDYRVSATENREGTILLFNTETGEPLKELSGHSDAIAHIEFSADGRRLLSRGRDETVRLWDVESGKEFKRFDCEPWWAWAGALTPDGAKLLYGDGGFLVLWDIETESEAWRVGDDEHSSQIHSVAISADGRHVATSTLGGPIHLRDAASGKLLGTFVGHSVYSVIAFTFDGRHLVSGNNSDKTLRVWSVETFSEICRIKGDRAITNYVAVLPDGQHVISGGGLRHVPPDQWIPEGDYDLHLWRLPESVWPEESATTDTVSKSDTLSPREAITHYNEIIRLRPDVPLTYVYRSEAHRKNGDYAKAIEDSTAALRIAPNLSVAYEARALTHVDGEAYDAAIADLSEAIRLAPEESNLYMRRAEACLWLGRYDETIADANRAVELAPENAETAFRRAQMLLIANRSEEYRRACEEIVDRFVELDDPKRLCHAARACVLARNAIRNPQVSIEMAKRAVSHYPSGAYPREWMLYTLGMAHLRAGDLDEARQCFRQSLDADPNWAAKALNWLGLALVQQARGDVDDARGWLSKVIESMELRSMPHTQDRIDAQLLLREAKQLLSESNVKDEPENDTKPDQPASG